MNNIPSFRCVQKDGINRFCGLIAAHVIFSFVSSREVAAHTGGRGSCYKADVADKVS